MAQSSKDTIVYVNTKGKKQQFYLGDTLFTKSGFKFYYGQPIKIGVGSGEKGYFKFIRLVNHNIINPDFIDQVILVDSIANEFMEGLKNIEVDTTQKIEIDHELRIENVKDDTTTFNPDEKYGDLDKIINDVSLGLLFHDSDTTKLMNPKISGKTFVVVNLLAIGTKESGYNFLPVIAEPINTLSINKKGLGALKGSRYYIGYEEAVNEGEIILPNRQSKKLSPVYNRSQTYSAQ